MSKVVKNGICRGLVGEEVSSENGNIIFRTMVFGVEVDLNLKKWMLEEQCSHEFFDKSYQYKPHQRSQSAQPLHRAKLDIFPRFRG